MSDEDSGTGKKGLDLSKLGLEMSDEERAAAEERLKEQFKELAGGKALMADALRDIGALSAAREAMAGLHGPGLRAAREAMAGLSNSHGLSAAQEAAAGLHEHGKSAAQEARKALGVLPEGYMDDLLGTQSLASGLHDRVRGLAGLGKDTSFSRIAAGLSEQQSILDSLHQDRFDVSPALSETQIPKNPLIETNKRLERIERRFDQISSVAETSAQTATELQLASAEFLKEFKEAASKNDEAAADAIRLGKRAVWAAILIPILVFGAQFAANTFMPNRETQALQQTVIGLQTEIDELQAAAAAAATQRLIDAIAASDEATAAAISEGLRGGQVPADAVKDTTPASP